MKCRAYMHTLDGRPARFSGTQIVYLTNRCRSVLRLSLDEIHEDQRRSEEYRRKKGYKPHYSIYSYRMFYV